MKTTNQILAMACRARDENGYEDPALAFPFSRKTEDGPCDIATTGKFLVAIYREQSHYALDAGPELVGDVAEFLRIVPFPGTQHALRIVSTRDLKQAALDSVRKKRAREQAAGKTSMPYALKLAADGLVAHLHPGFLIAALSAAAWGGTMLVSMPRDPLGPVLFFTATAAF